MASMPSIATSLRNRYKVQNVESVIEQLKGQTMARLNACPNMEESCQNSN